MKKKQRHRFITNKEIEAHTGKPWYESWDIQKSYCNCSLHFMCRPQNCKTLMKQEIKGIRNATR